MALADFLRRSNDLADRELMEILLAAVDHSQPEECDQIGGLADFFRSMAESLTSRLGPNEWGAMLISRNNTISFYRSGMYTSGSPFRVEHAYSTNDAANIVSVLHNHPQQGGSIDLHNRYPSDEDWSAATQLVAAGANSSQLTLGIIGPDGATRMFAYSDRSSYQNLSNSQMESGHNLPSEVPHGAVAESCVTFQ